MLLVKGHFGAFLGESLGSLYLGFFYSCLALAIRLGWLRCWLSGLLEKVLRLFRLFHFYRNAEVYSYLT